MSPLLINELKPKEGKEHIQEYLEAGEKQTVEFKQRLNKPEKIAKTICSLANTDGGTLLIGIRDDKKVKGVDPEQEKYILNEALKFYCEPQLVVDLTEVFVPLDEYPYNLEVSVLIVTVKESDNKPHKAKDKQGEWQVIIRHNDQSIIAGDKTEKILESEDLQPSNIKLDKNQKRLLAYLKKKERITQKEYMNLVNISERRARRELQHNLDIGLVRVLEQNKEDYYIL